MGVAIDPAVASDRSHQGVISWAECTLEVPRANGGPPASAPDGAINALVEPGSEDDQERTTLFATAYEAPLPGDRHHTAETQKTPCSPASRRQALVKEPRACVKESL